MIPPVCRRSTGGGHVPARVLHAQARSPERTIRRSRGFLRAFPDHPFAAKALVQRAVAYQQMKNYSSALADFNEVVNDHKDAKEREMALEQKALILGQQGDPRAMIGQPSARCSRITRRPTPPGWRTTTSPTRRSRPRITRPRGGVRGRAQNADAAAYGAKASLMVDSLRLPTQGQSEAGGARSTPYQKGENAAVPGVDPALAGRAGVRREGLSGRGGRRVISPPATNG